MQIVLFRLIHFYRGEDATSAPPVSLIEKIKQEDKPEDNSLVHAQEQPKEKPQEIDDDIPLKRGRPRKGEVREKRARKRKKRKKTDVAPPPPPKVVKKGKGKG